MDLRSIINNEAGEGSTAKHAAPVTPIQAPPHQQSFREYNQSKRASPGSQILQDYSTQPARRHASPTTYPRDYQGRPPPPPPIQAPPQNDLRSPVRSYSVQSPYQQTSSASISSGQYPFPQSHPTPQSPAQHHQFPPSFQQRETYPQSNPPPHLQHQGSQNQLSPAPQTPPVGIPGTSYPYVQHHRSQSSVSTPTPTSAQSQHQYHNQYTQDSPVSSTQFPPSQLPQHHRQQSQPGTPLGPPLRQSSSGLMQPSSPYQQRATSSGPFSSYQQTSPAQPVPASIPRLPSTPNAFDSHGTSVASDQHRSSQSERERSVSVSPKTRLPSQPRGEVPPETENGFNPSKRKMEDREVLVEEPRQVDESNSKREINGVPKTYPALTVSPQQPPKKRIRYTEPPIWARSVRNKSAFSGMHGPPKVNGKQPVASPLAKLETNGNRFVPPVVQRSGPIIHSIEPNPSLLLGPWEKSITGKKPMEQMTKQVADFLFRHVVSRNDLGELASRGVEVEIEAKLGQLINKDTNERFNLPVTSECILQESARIGFRSSMTEAQHKTLNGFLNKQVTNAHPDNPDAKGRVGIVYLHRREVDKFYEYPPTMLTHLPAAVRERLNPRHTVKVRITYDQKTNQPIAKIIKARIVDLDIFMPDEPLDCRISINFEMQYPGDIEDIITQGTTGERMPDRNKDRLSYTQGNYQLDLTQVTQTMTVNGVVRAEKEHELEIELSTRALMEQGVKAKNGEENEYFSLVEGMIDNMRVLARALPKTFG